ncbi:cobalamin trafficking protein CblD-like [Eriocheir sinensis]|uniref:cobalamin trafficking protein CblD-like n=1 Tax=Eriocheir sinensis TaxID=95602 RepID=UPI0021C8E537|nr:cobalamin trafficking protein CblD-like [Eriocheir sinensis]XP_050730765.1 cobalamin trafficking protein CblD-like [Eriocheir sinensis]XP_050730766.1 cobalamin trafficking protein CblD-like [Eriocheir sinensis]XP_050730767.1 cobalamin trafficking protein CblD-like [Eriocheir sinensis]XP_050730768.1 cobalamin trafficking protein CblD-like [Eriocheir sinensis]XP_050730769.1 cobalamin trafficking protein CblD-like [Eriocheir sinensis]
MAARLLCSGERIVVVSARSLGSLCAGRRTFSSQGSNNPKEATPPQDVKEVAGDPLDTWLDIRAGIFGPSDQRMPLPGNIGLSDRLGGSSYALPSPQPAPSGPRPTPDILTHKTNHEHQLQALGQCNPGELSDLEGHPNPAPAMPSHPADVLECKVQTCPDLVKKDFLDLFPGRNLREGPLSVVTLSQRTKHDMSCWSEGMEGEREELQLYFILAAEDICATLQREGYWADFIDPVSGRPYLGQFTNATLFETDERYRHLGFRIEDLGCCKIISHRLWGTNVFVGAIFTNAPINSEVLDQALNKHEKGRSSSSTPSSEQH